MRIADGGSGAGFLRGDFVGLWGFGVCDLQCVLRRSGMEVTCDDEKANSYVVD